MAMVSMKDLLHHAYSNRYAVGAFEIVSLDFLRAVIQAAEKARSPVILNVVEAHFDLFDAGLLMAAVVQAAKRSSVPVAVHMDHCSSLDSVGAAINLGCNSVMYDASNEDLPANINNTRQAVELAHACGIPVEGELGHVAGIAGDNGDYSDDLSVHTSVQEAKVYVERSGVDFLAISIGTVHGRVHDKPRLDFIRLARIRESVDIPFVIHGGTGLSDQQYHRLIDHGVAKINCFTALAESAVQRIRTNLQQEGATYREVFARLSETIAVKVQQCMQMWGSAGRAAEVLMQCGAWQNIEHVIVYNTSVNEPAVVEEMLRKGKGQLSTIPGVLDVQIGKAIRDQGAYRYCWLIRFAHESVVESYRTHPIHVAYADTFFRPIAADRISNDYEIVDDFELDRQKRPMSSQGT
jgi:fructose-bisphosphate aldolase class II